MADKKLSIVDANGQPFIKREKPRHKNCDFCGTDYKTGVILVVSSNGKRAICDGCLGAAINYMKTEYGFEPDMQNCCWKKIKEEHPLATKKD